MMTEDCAGCRGPHMNTYGAHMFCARHWAPFCVRFGDLRVTCDPTAGSAAQRPTETRRRDPVGRR